MKIINNFNEWENQTKSSNNKLIERLMANLKPIIVIDNVIYLEYIGEENKKEVFFEYYNNAKENLINHLNIYYEINKIQGAKDLNHKKLEWLSSLVEKFQPQNINFSINNN